MKGACLLALYLGASSCFQTRKSHELGGLKHEWTDECCKAQRGYPCGTVFSKCCTKGCKTSWWGDKCTNGQQFTPVCESCSETCAKLSGIPCQISFDTKEITCCPKASCKVASHNLFNQAKGKISSTIDSVTGSKQQQDQEHQLIDSIYNSVGEERKCDEGTIINLGNCVKNTNWELTKLKILGD